MFKKIASFMFAALAVAGFTPAVAAPASPSPTPRCGAQAEALLSIPLACDADAASCNAWRRFRASHPFPFQSLVVQMLGPSEAVVIISEPPPVASREELVRFVTAVFSGSAPGATLRLPMGQDGWLADLVFHVRGLAGPNVRFPAGDGATVDIPSDLAERLRYLSEHLFESEELAYVDRPDAPSGTAKVVDNLQFEVEDLNAVTSDSTRSWSESAATAPVRAAFADLSKRASPGTWVDAGGQLVAFVVPKQTDVQRTRGAFRRFAVLSDQLVGAFAPNSGGMILLGRSRRIPLDTLPPLRFETLVTFAESLDKPLAQSYERMRSYAGRLLFGEHAGWDWAPAYLSSQLEDTEFGMLLNLADQQLKSISEHGEIRYAKFSLSQPKAYPFGEDSLSARVSKAAGRDSAVIFNWNTGGHGKETSTSKGRLVSASNTTALPVTYIVGDTLLKPDEASSARGSGYFADAGDSILSRVARNVFLYQAVGAMQPFSRPKRTEARTTKRSAAVSAVLVRETASWMKQKLAEKGEVAELVRSTGLPAAKFVGLMAAPEESTQEIVELSNSYRKNGEAAYAVSASSLKLKDDLKANAPLARAEFLGSCLTPPIELGGVISCKKSPHSVKGPAELTQDQLSAQLASKTEQFTALAKVREKIEKQLAKQAVNRRAAARAVDLLMRDELRRFNVVFADVLDAGRGAPSGSFVQTPSIVLSCNAKNIYATGGHNIDPIPAIAARPTNVKPTFISPPARSLSEALGARPASTRGSFLDGIRKGGKLEEPSDAYRADVVARAKLCDCDVYVERGQNGLTTLVETRPPPKTKHVLGNTLLVDTLAIHGNLGRNVVFEGFAPSSVSSMTRAALLKAKKAGSLPVDAAQRLFEPSAPVAKTTLRTNLNGGKGYSVGAGSLQALGESLAKRQPWKGLSIVEGRPGGNRYLVSVNLRDVGTMTVLAYDTTGRVVASSKLSALAKSELQAVEDATVRQVVGRVGKRLTQEASVQEVDFFLAGVGQVVHFRNERNAAAAERVAREN